MAITRPEPHTSIHTLIPEIRRRHPQVYAGFSKAEKQQLVEIVTEHISPTTKDIDKAYRQLKAKRQAELNEFFRDYESPESDPYELQRRSVELGITASEWGQYAQRRVATAEVF